MNVLITGGAGFIGSHLAERCLQEGWSVSVIDDLSTGSFQNIAHLKGRPKFDYTIDTVFMEITMIFRVVEVLERAAGDVTLDNVIGRSTASVVNPTAVGMESRLDRRPRAVPGRGLHPGRDIEPKAHPPQARIRRFHKGRIESSTE